MRSGERAVVFLAALSLCCSALCAQGDDLIELPRNSEAYQQSQLLYPQILEPIREGSSDALLVFTCGAFIEAGRYVGLLQQLQSTSALRLWVALLEKYELALDVAMESAIDEALVKVEQLGFRRNGSVLFMGGHSLGSVRARELALKRHKAQAFVQMGDCFCGAAAASIIQYPIPVLSLSGDRDGQISYQGLVSQVTQMAQAQQELTDLHTYLLKPVVIVPGMNHAQVYDGDNPNFERGDLAAEIPVEQAHEEIASAMASFFSLHALEVGQQGDLEVLRSAVDQNRERHLVVGKAMEAQGQGAEEMQVELVGRELTVDRVKVIHHDLPKYFQEAKPFGLEEITVIPVYMKGVDVYGLVKNMWVKFMAQEDYGIELQGSVSSAMEFNQRAFETAFDAVTEEAREKYLRYGKQLVFVDDLEMEDSESWDVSDLTILPVPKNESLFEVRSPVLKAPGVCGMKLLTVARAMVWIYADSFREKQKY